MILLERTENKITKYESCKNLPHIVKNTYQQDDYQKSCLHLFLINRVVNY